MFLATTVQFRCTLQEVAQSLRGKHIRAYSLTITCTFESVWSPSLPPCHKKTFFFESPTPFVIQHFFFRPFLKKHIIKINYHWFKCLFFNFGFLLLLAFVWFAFFLSSLNLHISLLITVFSSQTVNIIILLFTVSFYYPW